MSLFQTALPQVHSASLGERLRCADAATPSLIADVIGEVCPRVALAWQAVKSKQIGRLIRIGAWTEAALTLVELELPQWKVRRLAYDGGEWYCALSRERELPDWLDEAAEGHHRDLALAVLSALVEARCQTAVGRDPDVPRAPRVADSLFEPALLDNFS